MMSTIRPRDQTTPEVRAIGEGPPLVLVPGMDGTGRLFYRQAPLLARSFRVAALSLRDEAQLMDVLVEDLAGFVRALSPSGEPAVVVGESFGGALSLSFALAHPELVRALVIVNSFAHFRPQYRLRAAILGTQLMPWGAMGLIRRATAFRMHSRHTPGSEVRRFLQETRSTTRLGYLNRLRILMQYDAYPHLHRIEVPTLFLAADEDHLIPSVEQARLMAARVPRAQVAILEGHGHVCLISPHLDLETVIRDWGALRGPGVT